jgi:hypothetical protein
MAAICVLDKTVLSCLVLVSEPLYWKAAGTAALEITSPTKRRFTNDSKRLLCRAAWLKRLVGVRRCVANRPVV